MDPNATLRQMLEHMAEGERDGALDALDVLRDWLMGGGFLPEQAAQDVTEGLESDRLPRLTRGVQARLDEIDGCLA